MSALDAITNDEPKWLKDLEARVAKREAEEDAWLRAQEARQKAKEASGIYGWKHGHKVMAYVCVKNNGSSNISLDNFKNWHGSPVCGSFPANILPHGEAVFYHVKDSRGSIAAVQYVGKTKSGNSHAIILAWDAPTDYGRPPKLPNRVYTIHGTKSELDKMSWDKVLAGLEKASTSTPYASIVYQPDSAKIVANINFDGF